MTENIYEMQTQTSRYESILKEYYARYLIDVRGLSQSSVAHYYDALNNISRKLRDMKLINNNIYEIDNLEQLAEVREKLYADAEFIEQNERGKRMYSAGLNNYYRFASGEDFQNLKDKILLLDIPVAPKDVVIVGNKVWTRSSIIREQSMEFAEYTCEINNSHESFLAEKNNKPYMESHHAVPMRLQPHFKNSLDVYANIVCLCPVCHRRIHYGMKEDKCQMLNQIYVSRSERLAHSGISMSQQEFIDLVVNT